MQVCCMVNKNTKESDYKAFSVRLPTLMHTKLKVYCAKSGYPMGHVMVLALSLHLTELAKGAK